MNCALRKILQLGVISCAIISCSSESLKDNNVYNINQVLTTALTACHNKDYSEGKSVLEKVMTSEKANPLYWNALGICFALSNELPKASFYYELGLEAITLYKGADKKLAEAALLNNLGLVHLSYKKYNDAFIAFKKAETISPDLFSIQLNLSQLYLEFKHDSKALVILNKLENVRPGDIDVLYSLALIYSHQNEYEKALLTLSKIKSEKLNRPDIAGTYAFNLLKTNQLTEAQTMIEKRLSNSPEGDYEQYNKRNKVLEKEISMRIKELEAKSKQ